MPYWTFGNKRKRPNALQNTGSVSPTLPLAMTKRQNNIAQGPFKALNLIWPYNLICRWLGLANDSSQATNYETYLNIPLVGLIP